MPNICNFIECDEYIRSKHYLCNPHWELEQVGYINECANCGQHKLSEYEFCLTCKRKQSRSKKKASRTKSKAKVAESTPEYMVGGPDIRPRKDDETDVFYVYVLLLEGGNYYVGQTNDLRTRNFEHTTGQTETTKDKNPRLVWFSVVRTRKEAEEYEKFLNRLRKENIRAINRMVSEFLDLFALVHNPRKSQVN